MESVFRSIGTLGDAKTNGDGVHSVTIFANRISRDGLVLEPSGMDFSSYSKNPVVLYAHDFTGRTESGGLPIGRTRRLVRTVKGHIRAEFEFLPGDAFADRVRNAWQQGFLRGASMGWRAIESRPSEEGVRIVKSELLEWSIVAVPADPDAVRDGYRHIMETLIDKGDVREEVIFEALSDGGGGESTGGVDLGETRRRMAKLAAHARRSRG